MENQTKCEHLWEVYRTESRGRREDYRGHTFVDGQITEVVEVFCKKCLEHKKL